MHEKKKEKKGRKGREKLHCVANAHLLLLSCERGRHKCCIVELRVRSRTRWIRRRETKMSAGVADITGKVVGGLFIIMLSCDTKARSKTLSYFESNTMGLIVVECVLSFAIPRFLEVRDLASAVK